MPRQAVAVDEFHDQIVRANVVLAAHVGMVQRCHGSGLAVESRGEPIAYDLDRYEPINTEISRPVDIAHSTGTEQGDDLVRPDLGSDERVWDAPRGGLPLSHRNVHNGNGGAFLRRRWIEPALTSRRRSGPTFMAICPNQANPSTGTVWGLHYADARDASRESTWIVEDEHTVFLKTIIPSRKATKQYLGEESDHEDLMPTRRSRSNQSSGRVEVRRRQARTNALLALCEGYVPQGSSVEYSSVEQGPRSDPEASARGRPAVPDADLEPAAQVRVRPPQRGLSQARATGALAFNPCEWRASSTIRRQDPLPRAGVSRMPLQRGADPIGSVAPIGITHSGVRHRHRTVGLNGAKIPSGLACQIHACRSQCHGICGVCPSIGPSNL
jgi:hypothetical protein